MMVMALRARESSSTNLHDNPESVSASLSPDQRFAAEKAFSSVVVSTVREGVGNALGHNVLEILTSKGLFDDGSNYRVFDRSLQSLFDNGSVVRERRVVRDYSRNLFM